MSNVISITARGADMQFESLGVRTVVPANAVPRGQTQLIKITVITDVSKYITIREDEVLVAFGIQCQPDGLQLIGAPVTITIPHCMTLSQIDQISPILYSGQGVFGKYWHWYFKSFNLGVASLHCWLLLFLEIYIDLGTPWAYMFQFKLWM